MNTFAKIKIQQIPHGPEDTRFKVFQNGQLVWNVRTTYPTSFYNVKVFESDPLYTAGDFEARNYKFHSGLIYYLLLSKLVDMITRRKLIVLLGWAGRPS